jgi:hypothetical protein
VRVREREIELYAEGETPQQISTLNMTEGCVPFSANGIGKGTLLCCPF